MKKKVKLAIFDEDLKVRTFKKYAVSESGNQIVVKSGGGGHYMPSFDNNSFIELPTRFGKWNRIYLIRKGAKKCVSFKTEPPIVSGPDPELVLEAASNKILRNIGKEEQNIPWINYVILGLSILTFLIVAGVAG